MSDTNFYHDLEIMPSLEAAMGYAECPELPDDWWIVITDVVDSSGAIAKGRFRAVNTVAVASIASVVNVDRDIKIPFVFGGDGATFAVPSILLDRIRIALRGARHLAMERFGLDLRVGLIASTVLKAGGFSVRLGKIRLSRHVTLPMFSGNGWMEAEYRVKAARPGDSIMLDLEGPKEADFSGFECRWKNVPSLNDHKLSLIVRALVDDHEGQQVVYRQVLKKTREIFGDPSRHHPLQEKQLHISFSPARLSHETRVRTQGQGIWKKLVYLFRLYLLNIAGSYLFATQAKSKTVDWGEYKREIVANSDYRRFNGSLNIILDATQEQTRQMTEWLDQKSTAGQLAYGLHTSSEAMVTCLVESYNGKHMHFVDGTEGGFTAAARSLKEKLKPRAPITP